LTFSYSNEFLRNDSLFKYFFKKKKKKKKSKKLLWYFNKFANENIDEDTVYDDDNEKQY
jgi:hypothetical protein